MKKEKVYDLAGVGGSEEFCITVHGKSALLMGGLGDECEFCGDTRCVYSCDESQADDRPDPETDPRVEFNHNMTGVESLLVALAARGYVMDDPKMIGAINDAVDACRNMAEA